jgi:hypothetical protein
MQRCRFVVLALLCGILAGCGAASKSSSMPAADESASSGSGGGGSPAPPTPIAVVDSFPISGWQTCGTCGNTGGSGNGATANYSVLDATTPSVDGDASKFSIQALDPYANAYWWYVSSATYAASKHVAYEFQLYIPSAARDASQAVEFEFQQSSGGVTYNFAWQANFGSNVWRNFDYLNRAWVATTVPLTELTPDTWHKIRVEGTRTDTTVTNTSISIDGNVHTVNSQFAAKTTGNADKFTNAFQLDSDKNMDPYAVYVDSMKVEIY